MLSQEIYRVCAITSPDSTTIIFLLLRFILPPTLQAIIQLHLLFVVVDVAETGSAVVVMDVPSHHNISSLVADLNAKFTIILAIMLTSASIVMMIWLTQLLFFTLMVIVQSILIGMWTIDPLIT